MYLSSNMTIDSNILHPSEGSVSLSIQNADKLMRPQKAGKSLMIKCDLDAVNVR